MLVGIAQGIARFEERRYIILQLSMGNCCPAHARVYTDEVRFRLRAGGGRGLPAPAGMLPLALWPIILVQRNRCCVAARPAGCHVVLGLWEEGVARRRCASLSESIQRCRSALHSI